MTSGSALPNYEELFGDVHIKNADEGRSVYSPAAYLADLLQLLDSSFAAPPLEHRRPKLDEIPLNAEHTYTELPYLDIVNEVLQERIGENPEAAYEALRALRFPFDLPFSLDAERLKLHLDRFQVSPAEFYRRFAARADEDVVAREYLGLTEQDVTLVTTTITEQAEITAAYQVDSLEAVHDVGQFRRATTLTGAELRELLCQNLSATEQPEAASFFIHQGGTPVTLSADAKSLVWGDGTAPVPPEWFERVSRFVRLVRKTGLPITDLDLVLRSCCGNRIDLPALRTIAAVRGLHDTYDLPTDTACALVAPMNTIGRGEDDRDPQDLFNRVFNMPFRKTDRTVLAPTPTSPPVKDKDTLTCGGDILAEQHKEFRLRVARALGMAESDITTVVTRYRDRPAARLPEPSPFGRGAIALADLSLLHRISVLVSALGISVDELFGVLDALESDPALPRHTTFPLVVDTEPTATDCYRILDAGDCGASLWLTQVLAGVVRWMQAHGLAAQELIEMLGGAAAQDDKECVTVLEGIRAQFEPAVLTPEVFVSRRFSERASEVIHDMLAAGTGVVSTKDSRLLRIDRDTLESAAYFGLTRLAAITEEDFLELGLHERLTEKIFTNLVLLGLLGADGRLSEQDVPATELVLATDFSRHQQALFDLLADLSMAEEPESLYPSDLAQFDDLTDDERAELYDNLVYAGYLDADGAVLRPDFFASPENVTAFAVTPDLGDLAPAVLGVIRGRLDDVRDERLALDPEIFAALGLPERQLAELLESLRFNGYLSKDGYYEDKAALATLPLERFTLALSCYPHRRAVLDAMRSEIAEARADRLTFTPEDFAELADGAAAKRVAYLLDDTYLSGERVVAELRPLLVEPDSELPLGEDFTPSEQATIFGRIAEILKEQQAYELNLTALTELGFDDDERERIVALLIEDGRLTDDLTVPWEQLAYFGNVGNALTFTLTGFEDYGKDVFFLLHAVATELTEAVTEITGTLEERAAVQRAGLCTALQAAFGVPADAVEAICQAVLGSVENALDLLVAPVLGATDDTGDTEEDDEPVAVPTDSVFRLAYRRVRRFALLAAKLGMSAAEVSVAFADQDLVGKFPEPLALPAGVDRIDALLEDADGTVYVFAEQGYWVYQAATYALAQKQPKPLTELSKRFAGLVRVDAAFTDSKGVAWLIGRDAAGMSHAFVKERGHKSWLAKEQVWGKVRNSFTDPAAIDTAFVDDTGRTYVFCGDQYVRYSTSDYSVVDEGYPRTLGEWREDEGPQVRLATAFRYALDASFHGKDGKVHLFKGDQCVAVGDESAEQPIGAVWGRVRNAFDGADRIDAAYTDGSAVFLVSGNQVARYSDCVEHDGVRVDDGSLVPITAHFTDVPAGFDAALDAAFVDGNGVVHLFKDGRTVALAGADREVVPTAQRWGSLGEVLNGGAVDAAFVGLDGRTYLFSGERYIRYSGADYTRVDIGYPRGIAKDWGGLRRVDAAFTQDGATYLFGTAGFLFELTVDFELELTEGRISPPLRRKLAEHGLVLPDGATVAGQAPEWQLTTDRGIRLILKREPKRIVVSSDPANEARFYVRYSTRDYTKADPGYPKPLSDNWWNLPAGLAENGAAFATVDAVLTGRDNRTYLFSGGRFVVFDTRHRWWSQPKALRENWDSIPFDRVDAAFVGTDGKTYLFAGQQYLRYSSTDYTAVDSQYPAPIASFWGVVPNTLARTGKVDATLVLDAKEPGTDIESTYTYLFSGDQYVRYSGHEYTRVDDGYPKSLSALAGEPRLGKLGVTLDRVDAAFADRRTVYLFSGDQWHAVSDEPYRRYTDLGVTELRCAFVEDGSVMIEDAAGWHRHNALESKTVTRTPVRPRALRAVPAEFRGELDAVLPGVDGNTYLFKGTSCFNTQLNRTYPLAEEWGRPRNNVYHDNHVDTAFVGRDGKTYVFSGDQFLTYTGTSYLDATTEGEPRTVADHWAGLTSVALAYVQEERTYLFEHPAADGTIRYLVYSGTTYSAPEEGFPQVTDAGFWGIPDGYRPADFALPDAVLFEGDTMLLVTGAQCVSVSERTGAWSYPRPVTRLWRDVDNAPDDEDDRITAAFTGRDGATYFFFAGEFLRHAGGTAGAREEIRDWWGRSLNSFTGGSGRVDAAVVCHDQTTFVFSGRSYVRYSGADYRYADAGYPKPIAGNLRTEAPFAQLGDAFEDALGDRVDAVVANERTVYVFVNGECHVASRSMTASYDLDRLGSVRNTIAEDEKVDAALVVDAHTYLFSGDQYVRYTGSDYSFVDHGYPRPLASLAGELGIAALPEHFTDRIGAAFRSPAGQVYLFAGKEFLRLDGATPAPQPIAGAWGTVRNAFTEDTTNTVDAVVVAPTGELYAFRGDQYLRYRPGTLDLVEEGYPRTIKDDWGNLPASFEESLTGAFTFQGRTYLVRDDEYVRYSGDYHAIDRTYPQPFRQRFANTADYRLTDVHTIVRFLDLARAHPGADLAEFLRSGAGDPYRLLADALGWDADELKWVQRRGGFLPADHPLDDRFEIELLLGLADLFAFADKFGAGPSRIFTEVWSRIYGTDTALGKASDALAELLARQRGAAEWPAVSDQLRDDLNERKRAALVSAVTTKPDTPELRNSGDLFEHLLIDVDMGSQARTSRIREAIAAAQLYLHRYLLNLEPAVTEAGAEERVRQQLKTWWSWMRSYRTWEANRKVFLYPENYLRPELRDTKTPAFKALEEDLLQSEITPASVQQAYKRYLDEYTNVSRLEIAGGWVDADAQEQNTRHLVLFGRTRTRPHRFYYRQAEFRGGRKLSTRWEPWLEVGLQIDAERVYPVRAFGRLFVFWAAVEPVAKTDLTTTDVETTQDGDTQKVKSPPPRLSVKVRYSFRDLNGDWHPAQLLTEIEEEAEAIDQVELSTRVLANHLPFQDDDYDSIVVYWSYRSKSKHGLVWRGREHALTPELYTVMTSAGVAERPLKGTESDVDGRQRLAGILIDTPGNALDQATIVRCFGASGGDEWFSIDHRGASFLFRSAATAVGTMKPLKANGDRLPAWDHVDAAVELPGGTRYFFHNGEQRFVAVPPAGKRILAAAKGTPTVDVFGVSTVDAVWTHGDQLRLTSGNQLYRYTIGENDAVPAQPDEGYPKQLTGTIDAAFIRDNVLYLFANGTFTTIAADADPAPDTHSWAPVSGAWSGLPEPFDAVFSSGSTLYFIAGTNYVDYDQTASEARPFELENLPYHVVRLTTSTAAQLNQKLLAGGVDALLDVSTQQLNELPAFTVTAEGINSSTIGIRQEKVKESHLPASTHLDFQSANGIYYWEIFFHAPLLIAQALNNAQRFEDAKRWYEYVFDPTEPVNYWRFLPFLSLDIDALAKSCVAEADRIAAVGPEDADALNRCGMNPAAVQLGVHALAYNLRRVEPAFRYGRPLTPEEQDIVQGLSALKWNDDLELMVRVMPDALTEETRAALRTLRENIGVIAGLQRDYHLMADSESLVKAYREDPFDPHRISALRPVAYRRAVVMTYIDNLLDWGDMLFRQYTPESVDEARMLYLLAHDLLGDGPETLGTRLPEKERTYAQLEDDEEGELDLLAVLTSNGAMLEGPGEVHASVGNRYFTIPGNSTFGEYWDRVEDRLRKIRSSQNILGISQPLPLFEPPIDPMSLVERAASGVLGAPAQGAAGAVPHYRFSFLFRKAQELVDKLRGLGNDLLSVLERQDSEELSVLQGRQEGAILDLTRAIKDAQVEAATQNVDELRSGLDSAKKRLDYYSGLVKRRIHPLEGMQMASMGAAVAAHGIAGFSKIAAATAHGFPQVYLGPFNMGTSWGGENIGEGLDKASEFWQTTAEGLTVVGELFGVIASAEKSREDWQHTVATTECDIKQIGHQIAGAEQQLAVVRREREILEREIAHNESVATFMTGKFTNAELYQWMSGRLAELYFQAYNLAYDMAKAAERAYQFERAEDAAGFIKPAYWDSRRKGLLSGESLGVDLERLGKAYVDNDARGMEITKRVPLLGLDPMALLRLKSEGKCEFTLGEALYDYDFPGHFRRQIRTVTVEFVDAEGAPVELNATLTQLGHKTVLAADAKVVKYLLDPKGTQPAALRTDWRASQRIALSHVDERTENNGLFELRYEDERYLPFEGTGAVSTWRLEIGGRRPAALHDAVLVVKYSAEWGGEVFANAVKGMLKPYPAALFLDVAREFAPEWAEFVGNGAEELALPITTDLFPNMKGRQVTGIYPKYELATGGTAHFILDGEPRVALTDGKLVPTPGLTVGDNGESTWTFQLDGDKQALANLGLVLTYQAGVQ